MVKLLARVRGSNAPGCFDLEARVKGDDGVGPGHHLNSFTVAAAAAPSFRVGQVVH